MADNEYGWWYISNGTIDWEYEGLAKNLNGWWYIKNGTVDWNYNGVVNYDGVDYEVINGYAGN